MDEHSPRGLKRRFGTIPDRQLRQRTVAIARSSDLPLVHVTHVGSAREILKSRKLETRACPVFKKSLLYFFIAKPAYRLRGGDAKSHQVNRFPFVFLVSPNAVKTPYHVYPFDTGGAASGAFDEAADKFVFLEDYELETNFNAAAGHIEWAFGGLEAYLDGDVRKDISEGVPEFETVTRSFVDIAKLAGVGSNRPDWRASAVEIASSQDVNLKGNIELAIFPLQYLEDGQLNVQLMTWLNDYSIAWEAYNWQPNKTPNEFQEVISLIVRRHLRTRGSL